MSDTSQVQNTNFHQTDTSIVTCPVCGIKKFSSQYRWSTGNIASSKDVAGVVCNNLLSSKDLTVRAKKSQCINRDIGDTSGDSWQKREDILNDLIMQIK